MDIRYNVDVHGVSAEDGQLLREAFPWRTTEFVGFYIVKFDHITFFVNKPLR